MRIINNSNFLKQKKICCLANDIRHLQPIRALIEKKLKVKNKKKRIFFCSFFVQINMQEEVHQIGFTALIQQS